MHLVISCFRQLVAIPQITSYFLIPDWPCACFLPIIVPLSEVVKHSLSFDIHFFMLMQAPAMLFRGVVGGGSPSFDFPLLGT